MDTQVTNISASVIRHIGFHFKPYFGAEEMDGVFGALVFRSLPRRLVFSLPAVYRGLPISDPDILQAPARELLIKVEEIMRPMLDGDILKGDTEFTVKADRNVEFVVG